MKMDTDKWFREMNKMRAQMKWPRPYKTRQTTAFKKVTYPTKRWMTTAEWSYRVHKNKVRISILFITPNIAKWHDMHLNSIAIPYRPHTFFLEKKLRRPSKNSKTLVAAGYYTNTESRYIKGLELRADFVFMTLKFSAMPLPN